MREDKLKMQKMELRKVYLFRLKDSDVFISFIVDPFNLYFSQRKTECSELVI